jgi:hypothetical protein
MNEWMATRSRLVRAEVFYDRNEGDSHRSWGCVGGGWEEKGEEWSKLELLLGNDEVLLVVVPCPSPALAGGDDDLEMALLLAQLPAPPKR